MRLRLASRAPHSRLKDTAMRQPFDRASICRRAAREFRQRKAFGRPVSWSEALKISWRVAKFARQQQQLLAA